MAKISSYKELKVWQNSIELAEAIYRLCNLLPRSEQYGLISQMQRDALSVCSNIAEGHNRGSTKEFIYFIRIALGALAEIESQVILCERLGYFPKQNAVGALSQNDSLGKMLRTVQIRLNEKLP